MRFLPLEYIIFILGWSSGNLRFNRFQLRFLFTLKRSERCASHLVRSWVHLRLLAGRSILIHHGRCVVDSCRHRNWHGVKTPILLLLLVATPQRRQALHLSSRRFLAHFASKRHTTHHRRHGVRSLVQVLHLNLLLLLLNKHLTLNLNASPVLSVDAELGRRAHLGPDHVILLHFRQYRHGVQLLLIL